MKAKSEKPKSSITEESPESECKVFAKNTNVLPYLISLLTDFQTNLPLGTYSSAALAKDVETLQRRYDSEGLTFATITITKLSDGLLQYIETGSASYPGFRLCKKSGVYPRFLRELFSIAYDARAKCRTEVIKYIYQFGVAFSKLKGPYPASVLSKQLTDLVAVDEAFNDVDLFTPERLSILQQARTFIYELFKDSNVIEMAKPRPGPGATNTPVAKHLRYRPKVLYRQVHKSVDYSEYFWSNPLDLIHQTEVFLGLKQRDKPTSRFKFVHKKVGKARGICIEENEVQYLQQAFRRSIYDWIETHPLTKGKVNFRSQKENQRLALAASRTLEFATIDESEASNRIYRDVVAWLFQDLDILEPIMALSTRIIEFPDYPWMKPLHTNMYAPMGSALCFPIMSVVHWALARSIFFLHGGTHRMNDVYVYGDDIIVPTDVVALLYKHFPLFNIKININKSFYRGHFRESCGVHAYNGEDITPIYFKYIPNKPSIELLMSIIALEQQAHEAGYRHVAQKLREEVVGLFGSLPFVSATSSLLGFKRKEILVPQWVGPTPKYKYDVWGNPQVRCRLVSPKQRKDEPPTEYECYLRHVLTRTSSREMAGNPSSFSTKWRYVTLPASTGRNAFEDLPSQEHLILNKIEENYEFYTQFYVGCPAVVHTESFGRIRVDTTTTILPMPKSRLINDGRGLLSRVPCPRGRLSLCRRIPRTAVVGRSSSDNHSNQARFIRTRLVRIVYNSKRPVKVLP